MEAQDTSISSTSTQVKHTLCVSISKQKMVYKRDDLPFKHYTISTSMNPPSCIENSFGTPWGRHTIVEKIGENAPNGMVFVGRVPTGLLYPDHPENLTKRLITSRILRLQGLEPGLNAGECKGPNGETVCCDTFKRYVYIHGTNREADIGKPASIGCIQMLNIDIIELFDLIPLQAGVEIKV